MRADLRPNLGFGILKISLVHSTNSFNENIIFFSVTEICGPKYRTYFGILTQFPFGIGAALLPIIAYFIRSWQNLQLAISIPCVLLGLYYFFVPESPRWLMAEGRIGTSPLGNAPN